MRRIALPIVVMGLPIVWVGLLAPVCLAGKVEVWSTQGSDAFEAGTFTHTLVTSEDRLQLSRQVDDLVSLKATFVWALACTARGELLAGTGNEGKIFKIVGPQVSVFHESGELEVLCLCTGPGDVVYAGTGPNGKLLRLDATGKATVNFKSPDPYIWSLALGADGTLYAGTGPQGKIYRIRADGQSAVFYDSPEKHILSLAVDAQGRLYAGTSDRGLVYRLDAAGRPFVVYDASESEIRCLALADDGTLYAGTSSPRPKPSVTSARQQAGRAGISPDLIGMGPAGTTTTAESARPSRSAASRSKTTSSRGSTSSRKTGQPNSVYRIRPDGSVDVVFREKKMMVLAVQPMGKKVWVGTGATGQLFEVVPDKDTVLIARVDQSQVLSMVPTPAGVVFGTGDPAKLYRVADRMANSGTFDAKVRDAKMISRWGRAAWDGTFPAGTRVTLQTRSGNVAQPDATWSDWSPPLTVASGAPVTSPAARFLQFRLSLSTTQPKVTPEVTAVKVYYMTHNQAPEVTAIKTPGASGQAKSSASSSKASSSSSSSAMSWKATDPNGDTLQYALYFRKQGWTQWVCLKEKLRSSTYKWNTQALPSGRYQVKVVASDAPSNPPAQAKHANRVSDPFAVDNQAPVVRVKADGGAGGKVTVVAHLTDALSRLTGARYSLDSKTWTSVFPDDGIFDSEAETVRFTLTDLKPGPHVIIVSAGDAAGNTGSGDTEVTVP